jgi:raffinose/stachyose/melibiose transport system permease protein
MIKLGRKKKKKIETVIFTIPSMMLVSITIYIPFLLSGYYALTEWNGIAKEPKYIGIDNFVRLFQGDQNFLSALIFTGRYTLLYMVLTNVLAISLAVVLIKKLRTANLLRGIFFIPYIMSMTIVGFIWKFIFSQGFAGLYDLTGFSILNYSWLGDVKLVFYSVVLVGVWQSVGFYVVLYIAGLQAIPKDVLEAATVDGANARTKFFYVTLPLLAPSITTCVLMSLINALKVFDTILALTKGGPAGSTYSVTLDIYREAFQNNNYGFGSAKALIFFGIVLLLTQIVLKGFKRKEVDI